MERSIEQAAAAYNQDFFGSIAIEIQRSKSFKAGAKWQREQLKQLIDTVIEAIEILELEGATTTAQRLKEAIEKFTS